MSCLLVCAIFLLIINSGLKCAPSKKENNVCKTIRDYLTMKNNPNCWYNPDVNAKPEAIAKHYGYKLEKHKIVTQDGYILTLHRVSKRGATEVGSPAFLHHGITMTSVFWMIHGKQSLAFDLVERGYDVWMANARGNDFSMEHTSLKPSDPKFWDFSFHEMAVYDVPAYLEYISKITNSTRKIVYIGHSMGTTISYIYSSLFPDNAERYLEKLVSIAPISYVGHMKTWAAHLHPYLDLIKNETEALGIYGSGQSPGIKSFIKRFCNQYPFIEICQFFKGSFIGTSLEEFQPETLPLFFRRYPGSFSIKTFLHYLQELSNKGNFQWYDYGQQENLLRYNSPKPPNYKVKDITIPVHLIFGKKDLLSTEKDVLRLYNELRVPKSMTAVVVNKTIHFNHNDFLYSKHIGVFCDILSKIMDNDADNKV